MMTSGAHILLMLLAMAAPAGAQYPGHMETTKKAAPTIRAVAVVEWTGDKAKPSASRLIPISVFDGEQYQPGGLYLAKPEPLALEPGTEYVLENAGVARGLFDINSAQDVDGYWFGYGAWKPMAAPAKKGQGAEAGQKYAPSGIRFGWQAAFQGTGPKRQLLCSTTRRLRPAPRPLPVARRPAILIGPPCANGLNPPRRRPRQQRKQHAPETAIGGADPDRPHMAHGQQTPTDEFQPPQLTGVPTGLQQMIAVSDASDRE